MRPRRRPSPVIRMPAKRDLSMRQLRNTVAADTVVGERAQDRGGTVDGPGQSETGGSGRWVRGNETAQQPRIEGGVGARPEAGRRNAE